MAHIGQHLVREGESWQGEAGRHHHYFQTWKMQKKIKAVKTAYFLYSVQQIVFLRGNVSNFWVHLLTRITAAY